ncbi:nuclear receptor subfamily 0 group B member 2-like isoform X2 [Betta splendens]|uniref:Nuclear receptor subfamily 0 group B member 2-like isoform X2 n=1 Tax=Betta splendens TaxID=158456 RepID=A0A6P7NXR4_BETSP|nr:nuclear receptor subfamily 0 group B member 2-like isoform X2 [Betta splendens]
MFPLEENQANYTCLSFQHQQHHTTLQDILSRRNSDHHSNKLKLNATVQNCRCEQRRRVCLKEPKATHRMASSILVKTVCFMRSLPSFGQLPLGDQLLLLRHGWVPLFVMGLAQEKTSFEVTDVPNSSILRQILLGPGCTEKGTDVPTLDKVNRLRTCLHHLWNLDLSQKEYAYIKAVQGLSALSSIEGLQQEAQRVLQEVSHLLHPQDTSRFGHILVVASTLPTVGHGLVTELFFRPIIGNTDMLHWLSQMLFIQ